MIIKSRALLIYVKLHIIFVTKRLRTSNLPNPVNVELVWGNKMLYYQNINDI